MKLPSKYHQIREHYLYLTDKEKAILKRILAAQVTQGSIKNQSGIPLYPGTDVRDLNKTIVMCMHDSELVYNMAELQKRTNGGHMKQLQLLRPEILRAIDPSDPETIQSIYVSQGWTEPDFVNTALQF